MDNKYSFTKVTNPRSTVIKAYSNSSSISFTRNKVGTATPVEGNIISMSNRRKYVFNNDKK